MVGAAFFFPALGKVHMKSKAATRARARFTLRLPKPLWKTYRRFALRLDVPATALIVNALNFYAAAFQLGRRRK